MAIEKTVKINVETNADKAGKEIKELFNDMLDAQIKADKKQDELNDNVKRVGRSAEIAKKGVKTLAKGFTGVGLAIKAAGIGLFISLLSVLKDAFMSNEKVQKAFSIGMDFLSSVIGEVVDVIDSVVTSVAESTNGFESLGKVLSGLLTIAITPLKLAFLGISRGIAQAQLIWEKSFLGGNDAKKIKELTESIKETDESLKKVALEAVAAGKKVVDNFGGAVGELGELGSTALNELSKLEIKSSILRSKERTKFSKEDIQRAKDAAAKKKEILDRENQEEKDRLQLLQDFRIEQSEDLLSLEAKTLEAKLQLQRDAAQKELDLLIGTETEKRGAQIALNSLFDAKEKELAAQRKSEKETKEQEERDEAFEKSLEDAENEAIAFEERRAILDARAKEIANDATLTDDQRTKLEKENSDARKKLGDEELKAKIKQGAALSSALNTASELLGKSTAAGKVAAIASTTIDTISSGVSAFKGMVSSIPGPVGIAAGAVAAAGALASGFASVKKILAVKTPGGGGGGAPSAPTPPQAPAFNLVGQSGVNQVQESIEAESNPIKAFVVGADVTNQQEIDSAQASSASLG